MTYPVERKRRCRRQRLTFRRRVRAALPVIVLALYLRARMNERRRAARSAAERKRFILTHWSGALAELADR